MSVSLAISTIAMAQANAAAAAAHQASVTACEGFVNNYQLSDQVSAMKAYARCIDLLYPDPVSSGDIWIFKLVFVVALIGLGLGAKYGFKNAVYGDKILDTVMFGFFGFFLLPICIGGLVALLCGCYWLVML